MWIELSRIKIIYTESFTVLKECHCVLVIILARKYLVFKLLTYSINSVRYSARSSLCF